MKRIRLLQLYVVLPLIFVIKAVELFMQRLQDLQLVHLLVEVVVNIKEHPFLINKVILQDGVLPPLVRLVVEMLKVE
jgi:hypothetical protein